MEPCPSLLEQSLKTSSEVFFKKLRDRKPWTLIVPLSFQWDGNPLNLSPKAFLPKAYSQNYLYRLMGGAMYSYEPTNITDAAEIFKGYGVNALYLKNLPSEFKSFDTVILSGSLWQTWNGKAPSLNVIKVTETMNGTIIDTKTSELSLGVGINYVGADVGATFGYDIAGTNNIKYHYFAFREAYSFPVWTKDRNLKFDIDTSLTQKAALKSNDSKGSSLAISTTPSMSLALGAKTSVKTLLGLSLEKGFFGTKNFDTKFSPQFSVTQFVAPWLLIIGNGNWDYTIQRGTNINQKINKPGLSIMFTGMF